jgi:hypothetical protein
MLESARSETRLQAGARAGWPTWGIVDVILAVILLPFGIGMWIIDRLVWVIATLLGG